MLLLTIVEDVFQESSQEISGPGVKTGFLIRAIEPGNMAYLELFRRDTLSARCVACNLRVM